MGNALKLYAKHLAIAWPGLWLATALLAAILDRTAVDYLFDTPSSAPYFAGYWVVGLLVGYWLNRMERASAAQWVWLPPLVLLAWAFRSDYLSLSGGWLNTWGSYFTKNCTRSECLGEAFATIPFYTCVAYSLGAWWARRRGLVGGRAVAHMRSDGSQA